MACFARSFQKISIGSMPKACCMAALIASTYLCLREGGRAFKEESPEAATPPFDTEKFLIGLACSLCMIFVIKLAILITPCRPFCVSFAFAGPYKALQI